MGVEPDDPALAIGQRVASHRARRGMRVSALARRAGVSLSLVSQIERGRSRPSVSTLFALAEALEVPVDAFFRDGEAEAPAPTAPDAVAAAPAEPAGTDSTDRYLVRRDQRAVIDIAGGVRWERLTPGQLPDVEFLELVYAPRAESHPTLYRHPGLEMVVVLSGRLDIDVGFDRYELTAGDSICFPSTRPHRYRNPTDDESRAITAILDAGARQGPPGAPIQ